MVFGFVYTGGFAVLLVGCIGYFFACERVRCVVWLELMGVVLSIWFVFRLLGVAFACVGGLWFVGILCWFGVGCGFLLDCCNIRSDCGGFCVICGFW